MIPNPTIQCVSISEIRPDESMTSSEQNKPKVCMSDWMRIFHFLYLVLQGILKKQHSTRSYSLPNGYCVPVDDGLNLEISVTSAGVTLSTNNSNDVSLSRANEKQSVSAKRVTFSERILRKKYKPSQPVSRLSKSSHRQQCHLKINQPKRSIGSNAESTFASHNTTLQRRALETVILFDSSDDDDHYDE